MSSEGAAVTVLMPVKSHHPQFLVQAVGSILGQTSPCWRLVVIGEKDNVSQLTVQMTELAGNDDRVRVIGSDGRGLARAINTGMRRAGTPFVAILLGDDMWAPDAVAVLSAAIHRHPGVDFFHSSRAVVDETDRLISAVYPAKTSFTVDDFVQASPVKHLLCWRRETALAIGGLDERGVIGPDDWDFPWSMAEAGARFHPIAECLYLYRDHRDWFRITTHVPLSTQMRDMRRVLRKHGVGRLRTFRSVNAKKATHLRQCLYRNPLDRLVKERLLRIDPRDGWRERYR